MSQHDYVIADAAGPAFLADLNLALPALASLNSGATAPATTYAYMLWADTTSGWLKQRNAANSAWIHVAPLGTRAWVDVASATTVDLDANAANSDKLRITGTTATTAITLADGQTRLLRAAAAWPITHGASLICPGSASYTCTAGDLILAIGEAGSVVRLMIWKANGTAVSGTGITMGTPVASTSGTSIDFTGIPSTAKRITVMLNGVSTNGTSPTLLQLGDSGGVETSGYLGSDNGSNFSAGFIFGGATAANVRYGTLVLNLVNSSTNTWSCFGVIGRSDAATVDQVGGIKATSATLDRVRLTTVNGTDAFDAGEVNISWE
jgi:hypothetical protein